MKPVQFPIKMLTLLTIFQLGPVQAAPQQGLRLSTPAVTCLLTAAFTGPLVTA